MPGANSEVTGRDRPPARRARRGRRWIAKQMPEGLIRLVLPPTGHVDRPPRDRRRGRVHRERRPSCSAAPTTGTRVSKTVSTPSLASAVSTPAVDGVATFRALRKGPAARSPGHAGRSRRSSQSSHPSRRPSRAWRFDDHARLRGQGLEGHRPPRPARRETDPGRDVLDQPSRLARGLAAMTPRGPIMTSARSGDDGRFEARCEVDPATITPTEARLADRRAEYDAAARRRPPHGPEDHGPPARVSPHRDSPTSATSWFPSSTSSPRARS